MTDISIIIPTYDCARFLPESLDSVLGQTCSARTEVIVVDDGSTDDTPAVLAGYGDRITVVTGENGGYGAARNLGLASARGEWIAFHDADDVALPDRLAWQLDLLTVEPGWDGVFANGHRLDTGAPLVPSHLARRVNGRALRPADVFAGFPVYFQGALVRRAAFDAVGAFDASLRIHADMEFGYRLFASHRLRFVDRPAFRYRWHTGNVTRDRLRGREEIARVLAGVDGQPALARQIGRRRLRSRLARHYHRIARGQLRVGNVSQAGAALAQASALRPLDPRYRLLRLWYAR